MNGPSHTAQATPLFKAAPNGNKIWQLQKLDKVITCLLLLEKMPLPKTVTYIVSVPSHTASLSPFGSVDGEEFFSPQFFEDNDGGQPI